MKKRRFLQERQELVLGAEACLWGEHTNAAVMNVRVWPRAAVSRETASFRFLLFLLQER
jgi:N-acetyl-beta-hexosaminidase